MLVVSQPLEAGFRSTGDVVPVVGTRIAVEKLGQVTRPEVADAEGADMPGEEFQMAR